MLKLKSPIAKLKKNEQTMAGAKKKPKGRKAGKTSKKRKGCGR
jgi:hypothetical protein